MKDPRAIIKQSGGEYLGIRNGLVSFNDPVTGSTLSLPEAEVTAEAVVKTMVESRRTFKEAKS